jgi:hypothetical protein
MRIKSRYASVSRHCAHLLAAVLAIALFTAAPIIAGAFAPAQAQARVSVGFRPALEPYGRWERHARWGEVWLPANRSRDWRPYTVGRWVYSNDWGWYWAEDQEEAAWGWVTYHYGRWVSDSELGWVWVPGDEWGPAFVEWRHGGDYVGWAPMPPDEIIVEYRDEPEVWIFVRIRDFAISPRLVAVMLPVREYPNYLRETVVVNQTVLLRERGRFAVDPGIPPAIIAAAMRRPLRTYDVRPRILAGTAQIPGAIEVRDQDLRNAGRNRNIGPQASVRETPNAIAPTGRAPQLRPLAAGEQGRLGDNPPRAATGLPPQQQAQPSRQQGQQRQPPQQQGQEQPSQSTTQGQGQQPSPPPPTRQREEGRRLQNQQQGQQPGSAREPAQTQGRGSEERRQQLDNEGRHEIAPQRQQPQPGRSGVDSGRAGPQEHRSAPGATEGRGGGGGPVAPPQHGPSGPSGGGGGPAHAAPPGGGPAGAAGGREHPGPRP